MVLNIYKEQLDKLDLVAIANEFVGESDCSIFCMIVYHVINIRAKSVV